MTGEMIAAARAAQGLTQAALARRLGMKTPQLCKIERGVSEPRPETLERIAAALGLTVDAMRTCEYDARRGAAVPSPYQPVRSACRCAFELVQGIGRRERRMDAALAARKVSPATTVPLVHGYLLQPHANEILARSLRDSLGVGTAAFSDLFWTLSFANVRIHRLTLPEGLLSASWWHPERETLTVALEKSDTLERQTFRLAYELGAACLFRSSGNRCVAESKTERRFLGAFAADFLMPASALADMVAKTGLGRRDWTLDQLCAFKAHFGVSAEALVIRLDELGLIDRNLRTRLRDDLRAYYKSHPTAKEPPLSRTLRDPNLRWEVMG